MFHSFHFIYAKAYDHMRIKHSTVSLKKKCLELSVVEVNATVNKWTQQHKLTSSKKTQEIDQITTDFAHSGQAAKIRRGKLIGGEMS